MLMKCIHIYVTSDGKYAYLSVFGVNTMHIYVDSYLLHANVCEFLHTDRPSWFGGDLCPPLPHVRGGGFAPPHPHTHPEVYEQDSPPQTPPSGSYKYVVTTHMPARAFFPKQINMISSSSLCFYKYVATTHMPAGAFFHQATFRFR